MSETTVKSLINRKEAQIDHKLPIKVIQFGEGNFLRAFVDYAFHTLNQEAALNAGVAVIQPIDRGLVNMLNEQEGLYTLFIKGLKNGKLIQDKQLISNIVKAVNPYEFFSDYLALAKEEELQFIISNTTEAGISYIETDTREMTPPSSFPAKLTLLLHQRFTHFNGDPTKGLIIIPCELINHNADNLKSIILKYVVDWELGEGFKSWLLTYCTFHNTLVDRIVPGYPKNDIDSYNEQLDYRDNLIVTAEPYFLWVIEGGNELKSKLPFHKTDLDVKVVADMQPYRTRKVRILNGAHTCMVPFSILSGNITVKETIEDSFTGSFIKNTIFKEIIPILEMDKTELETFANDVLDRFLNPFVYHKLSDIALNSISKFKVRVLPSLLEFIEKNGKLPIHLTFSFACLIRFYKGEWKNAILPINDNIEEVTEIQKIWSQNDYLQISQDVLSNVDFWGKDLTKYKGLSNAIAFALEEIERGDIEKAFLKFSSKY